MTEQIKIKNNKIELEDGKQIDCIKNEDSVIISTDDALKHADTLWPDVDENNLDPDTDFDTAG